MPFFAPKSTPPLSLMLEDIGQTDARVVARHLGVSERTVRYWQAKDDAPRPAMLALFWQTRWGQDHINCQAINDARFLATSVAILEAEVQRLRTRVAYLEGVGEFGSANAPTFTASPLRSGPFGLASAAG